MEQTLTAESPSLTSAGFASLLSALITSAPKSAEKTEKAVKNDAGWNDDDLADDFATLSYERAMRSHARYHSSEFEDSPQAQVSGLGSLPDEEKISARKSSFAPVAPTSDFASSKARHEPETTVQRGSAYERNLKNASITIRLSKAEYVQLHERAAEAGLTVSAYLRSCTFEAESLRAQVKETLAQLRAATSLGASAQTSIQTQPAAKRSRFEWLKWLKKPLPSFHPSPRVVRA